MHLPRPTYLILPTQEPQAFCQGCQRCCQPWAHSPPLAHGPPCLLSGSNATHPAGQQLHRARQDPPLSQHPPPGPPAPPREGEGPRPIPGDESGEHSLGGRRSPGSRSARHSLPGPVPGLRAGGRRGKAPEAGSVPRTLPRGSQLPVPCKHRPGTLRGAGDKEQPQPGLPPGRCLGSPGPSGSPGGTEPFWVAQGEGRERNWTGPRGTPGVTHSGGGRGRTDSTEPFRPPPPRGI